MWVCVYVYTDVPVDVILKKYLCCDEPFSRITFSVHLERKSLYYVMNLLVPTIIFSIITLISLTLQPGCSERIGLGLFRRELYICCQTIFSVSC